MKTPPKDGTMFIGAFEDYPTPLATMWNGANEEWMTAEPNVEPYDGKWDDWYFENQGYPEEALTAWKEI